MPAQAMVLCTVCLWCYDNSRTPCLLFRRGLARSAPLRSAPCAVVSLGVHAVRNLTLHSDAASFWATFSGDARRVRIGYRSVVAAFAQETGGGILLHGAAYTPLRCVMHPRRDAGIAVCAGHADLAHR